MGGGSDQINNNELLYRRIPVRPEYFDRDLSPHPSPLAFEPRKHDQTGISVIRAACKSPSEAARNDREKQFYIAVLRAGDLRAHGLDVVPREQDRGDGHAEIPLLNYADHKTDCVQQAKVLLALKLCREVIGPFP